MGIYLNPGNGEAVLKEYGGEILFVGISYNEKTKVHSCKIERNILEE